MYTDVDWVRVTVAVAAEFRGPPTRTSRREMRWGRKGSLQVTNAGAKAGTWYDYEAGKGGGAISLVCHLTGVSRRDAVEWLRRRGLLPDSSTSSGTGDAGARPGSHPPHPPEHLGQDRDLEAQVNWARKTWRRAEPIPRDNRHPVRLWLAERHLWHPTLPIPDVIRWLPADREKRPHTGAGSIVALVATPIEWAMDWPKIPRGRGVQLIAITVDGGPAALQTRQGWVDKQSRGVLKDGVVIIGNPLLCPTWGPYRVAEGLADAIALGARYEGPAIATLSAGAMRSGSLAKWLAQGQDGAIIHADDDAPGRSAAGALRRIVNQQGGRCAAVLPVDSKDPAAAASGLQPFPALPKGWQDYAITLRDCQPDWPDWEVYRVTGATLTRDLMDQSGIATGGRP